MKSLRLILTLLTVGLLAFAAAGPASAIVDGRDATEDYPFMGAFKPDFPVPPGAGGNGCGVTLIDSQWGLTASHCMKNNRAAVGSPKGWTVQFGSDDVTTGGQDATVSRFFRLATEDLWGKDLMLLRFAEPVDLTPIPVATTTPSAGDKARIIGWGATDETPNPSYPSMLQESDVAIRPLSDCPSGGDGEICVGTTTGDGHGKTGNADSGGPLLVEDGDGWAVAGVLSGPEDQTKGVAGLFTDATAQRDWIRSTMASYESTPDDAVDIGMGGFPAIQGCESSIVKTSASRDEDPALLVTNGHCVPTVDPEMTAPERGTSLTDEPVSVPVPFTDDEGYQLTKAKTERLIVATMTGTDLAVYRLDRSFAQLAADGVRVLQLAAEPPKVGDKVSLMTFEPRSCTIEAVVPTLREDGYEQQNALRMAGDPKCETFPGTSGAALVAADGTTLVGINNTNNREGGKCVADGPCEVAADGSTSVVTDQPYGQQVVGLNDCITAGSTFDADCTLASPEKKAAAAASPGLPPTLLLVGGILLVIAIAGTIWMLARRSAH